MFRLGGIFIKRFIALLLSIICTLSVMPAYAAYDYSSQLSTLSSLLEQCAERGIATDYETVNYNVIKRFEGYMNDDESNGVSSTIMSYNSSQITRLYNETKASLEGYLNGTKTPVTISRPNMTNLTIDGSVLRSGTQPVWSVGYGHFELAQQDVSNFQDFGLNNIQIQVGPNRLIADGETEPTLSTDSWQEVIDGTPEVTVAFSPFTSTGTGKSLHVTKNTSSGYHLLLQEFTCKPNTTYNFGCWSKGTTAGQTFISANGYSDRNYFAGSTAWKQNDYYYTTTSDQKKIQFFILVEGVTDLYIDNCYLYEIDETGKTGYNMLNNASFDLGKTYRNGFMFAINTLKAAQANNVAVNILLSPHYFPQNVPSVTYNSSARGPCKYNINDTAAKTVIKNYLDAMLPNLAEYSSLDSICLANEPAFRTTDYPDYYNPLFREYLEDIHGTIAVLNEAYGTSYSSFDEISMPSDISAHDALSYDWICFNDKVLSDWLEWMAGIVEGHLPEVPVHVKVVENFTALTEDESRDFLREGTDIELFGKFSDYAGLDAWDIMEQPETYYETMFAYDYQQSAVGKPVYNSENHIMRTQSDVYNDKQRHHWANNIWQGAVHGRSLATIWGWARTYAPGELYLSALTRPDIIAQSGETSLDLTRLASQVELLNQEQPKVALWYSKPYRLYSGAYSKDMMNAYKALLNIGHRPGIVSDTSVAKLSDYDVLVVTGDVCCYSETLAAVESFIDNGGKVIYYGNPFAKDEYKNELNNQKIISSGYNYTETTVASIAAKLQEYMLSFNMQPVVLKDNSTGGIPADLDWTYYIDDFKLLVNVTNLNYDSSPNISVYYNGNKVGSMKDLIAETATGATVTISGYTPRLLECTFAYRDNSVKNISADETKIKWEYENNDSNSANVYKVLQNGMIEFLTSVQGSEYTYQNGNSYFVKALTSGGEEDGGKMISPSVGDNFTLSWISSNLSNKTVLCDIQIKNDKSYFTTGVLHVTVKDVNGNAITNAYYRPVMLAGMTNVVNISMPVGENAYKIEAVMLDSRTNPNEKSNTIEKIFVQN